MNFEDKQNHIISLFKNLNKEKVYEKIINLGKDLTPLDPQHQIEENLVSGCQSRLYLHSYEENDRLRLNAHSDALISKGLAYLLIFVYDNELPETILKEPPTFLETLDIPASLSPSRANGLFSLYEKIKKRAYLLLLEKTYAQKIK